MDRFIFVICAVCKQKQNKSRESDFRVITLNLTQYKSHGLSYIWCSTLSVCQESLQWRHNERHGVSNHQPHYCLLNCLFRRKSKKTSKLHATGLCAGKFTGDRWIPRRKGQSITARYITYICPINSNYLIEISTYVTRTSITGMDY